LKNLPKEDMEKLIKLLQENEGDQLNKVDNEGGMTIQPEP